jgi:hypothetical protein
VGHGRLGVPSRDTYISPRFTARHWKALDLSKGTNPDWARAVTIFLDRINGRFLAPIEVIRRHQMARIAEFSGFAILAIDCLLIETLVQFHRGEDKTSGWHGDAFAEFFTQSDQFRPHFDTKQKAHIFYSHFRCGILHQAQTKKRSLVRYGLPTMVQASVPGNIDDGLLLDRELFHAALLREIEDYAERVRSPRSDGDHVLRRHFIRKMNLIAS